MSLSKKLSDLFARFKLGDGKLFGFTLGDGKLFGLTLGDGKLGDIPLYSSYNKETPVTLSDTFGAEGGVSYESAGELGGAASEGGEISSAVGGDEYKSKYADYSPSVQSAADSKDSALALAYKTREGSVADAQASYAQNKATYGNNAEMLAQMGLTGGGYSDYLNSQAYAQKRSDVRYADTLAADAIQKANATYGSYLNEVKSQVAADNANFKAEGDTMYGNVLDAAGTGQSAAYVDAAIAKYGEKYGWTEEQAQALRDVVENYKATYSFNLDDGSTVDVQIGNTEDILAKIDDGTITSKAQLDAVKKYAGDQYDTMLQAIQSGNYEELAKTASTASAPNLISSLFGENGAVTTGNISEEHAVTLLLDNIKTQLSGEDNASGIDLVLENLVAVKEHLSDTAYDSLVYQAKSAAEDRKNAIVKEKQGKNQPLIDAAQAGAFTYTDPAAASGAAIGSLISGAINNSVANRKAKVAEDTANTGTSGVSYKWDTKVFSLGKNAKITLADGTTDTVYLSVYAGGKVKKELGDGKEGQVKQASNGEFYVYDGTSQWVKIKNVDEGGKIKTN